jgi:hypothetical protein
VADAAALALPAALAAPTADGTPAPADALVEGARIEAVDAAQWSSAVAPPEGRERGVYYVSPNPVYYNDETAQRPAAKAGRARRWWQFWK